MSLPKLEFLVMRFGLFLAITLQSVSAQPASQDNEPSERVTRGLRLIYEFREQDGSEIVDRGPDRTKHNLRISNLRGIQRVPGSLTFRAASMARSARPVASFSSRIRQSDSFTVEVWIRPATLAQKGPARIVTVSKDSVNRNFTLGQEGNRYVVRYRTTKTSNNGLPALESRAGTVRKRLTHVVYTKSSKGTARLYLDGEPAAEKRLGGKSENWDSSYKLALGNEFSGDRHWLGEYRLVALYDRDLSIDEIKQNFRMGATVPALAERAEAATKNANERLFETRIAPLLASRCLECHDSLVNKGGLDLSYRKSAIAGGESGPAIVPGNLQGSGLWDRVESNDMPLDQSPLTMDEKKQLKEWISNGADWPVDFVDPAIYLNTRKAVRRVRRLTVSEYVATVKATLGVDIEREARELLPADVRADGFSNTAYNLSVGMRHIKSYAKLARIVANRVDMDVFIKKFAKKRRFTDDGMGKLVSKMGAHVLRGPLEKHEVISYRGISTTVAASGGDYADAVQLMLEAMLQSPRFIYRIEQQPQDETSWQIDGRELASRISYIVWGAPPDAALLKAAADFQLDEPGITKQLDRMFDDPRARSRALEFAKEWLDLERLDNLEPDGQKFPDWTPLLAHDMKNETLAYFGEIVWNQRRPLADLMNAQLTIVSPRLARHYGLTENRGEEDETDVAKASRYDLRSVASRGGLLTQGSILTIGGDEASSVTRGLFVLHDLLRGVVRDPPPCVDTTPIPAKPGTSQRDISEQRMANEKCGGCHARFEPLAFGMGKYDGIGAWHEKDKHGNRLRDDGQLYVPGESATTEYKNSSELMDMLASSERVQQSLVWKLTQFSIGRPLVAADAEIMAEICAVSRKEGGGYREIVRTIILSDLVQTISAESN